MNRRNIFKLLAGAACAASIELTNLVPSVPKMVLNPAWEKATLASVEYDTTVISPYGTTIAKESGYARFLIPSKPTPVIYEQRSKSGCTVLTKYVFTAKRYDTEYNEIPQFIPA